MFRLLARIVCGLFACMVAVIVVTLVLSNRTETTLSLNPLPYEANLPLYLVIVLSFLLGLSVGLFLYAGLKLRTSFERRKLRRQLAAVRTSN